MTGKHRFPGDERGFTLPELTVVVAVLGILIGIAIPIFLNLADAYRVESAANQLASDLRLAHGKATNRLETWEFKVPAAGGSSPVNTYSIGPSGSAETYKLNEGSGPKFGSTGITLYVCARGTVQTTSCNGYTSSLYHNLTVTGRNGTPSYTIRINAQTSNVRVCKGACS